MVKTRMGMLDLRVQASALHSTLPGARVANVYDAHHGRTYILKLAVPPRISSAHTPWSKQLVLIESGARVHLTSYDRDKDLPTGFCLKLRKHLRARRLESVRQVGGDRILEMVFSGGGEVVARLFIEIFAGGNVVLTDAEYVVLAVLRTYKGADGVSVAVREKYPLERVRGEAGLCYEQFCGVVGKVVGEMPTEDTIQTAPSRAVRKRLMEKLVPKKALALGLRMEPALVEHALLKGGLGEGGLNQLAGDEGMMKRVWGEIERVYNVIQEQIEGGGVGGVIVVGKVEARERYEEFWPFMFEQFVGREVRKYDKFDAAADEFFSRLETERAEMAQMKRERGVYKKVDKLANELKGQVTMFENARDLSWERAQAIEGNIAEVEAAITVIRSAIAAAVTWDGLAKMVKEEKKNGNPVAEIIHSLQLERNEITLMLEDTFGVNDEEGDEDDDEEDEDDDDEEDEEDEEDDELCNDREESLNNGTSARVSEKKRNRRRQRFQPTSQTREALLVSVDLSLGAHANARRYYEMRKSAAAKMEKAVAVTDRTLKAASKRAATEAHKIEVEAVAASIRARRKILWFEKFFWFISSENYLVVAGRDAQQNELLVNRYLAPNDIYVHAELAGASSVIVKNRRVGGSAHGEIPRMTLEQAGTFAMCRSAAWNSKIVTSAWWVRASQVAKVTASGVYLPTGSFIIRGKKNFLDPTQLVMGLAFLFKVDETSAERHKGEREIRGLHDRNESNADDDAIENIEESQSPASAGEAEKTMSARASTDEHFADTATAAPGGHEAELQVNAEDNGISDVSRDNTDAALGSMNESPQSESNEYVPIPNEQPSTDSGDGADLLQDISGKTESSEDKEPSKGKKVGRSRKKHMSAKERRALKSGKFGLQGSSDKQGPSNEGDGAANATEDGGSKPQGKGSRSNASLPRGKKHKLKKMKKYMDQDDEERRLALAVLGSKPIKREETGQNMGGGGEDDEGEDYDRSKGDKGLEPKRQRDTRQSRQEVMRLMDEEGLEELENLERETALILEMLTASPDADDHVDYALPVCAPYGALTKYRYKVKLMPGSTKRGQAYRSAVMLFQRQAERDLQKFKQDRDAIRISPEGDGIQSMLGGVKIMAPGLAEAQKAVQKAKKGGSKKDGSGKKGEKQK